MLIKKISIYIFSLFVIISALIVLRLSFSHLFGSNVVPINHNAIETIPITSSSTNTTDNYSKLTNVSNVTPNDIVLHRLRDRYLALNSKDATSSEPIITVATPSQLLSDFLQLKFNFPQVFTIGFAKAGTKALYEALKLHPQLSGPKKEMRYFTENYDKYNLLNYIKKFSHCPKDGFNVEKSPDYILSLKAAQRLKKAAINVGVSLTSLKFIVIVRNPVVRTVSDFMELKLWALQKKREYPRDFNEMILNKDGKLASCKVVNSSCYSYHLKQWMTIFEKNQFCFVNGDAFIHDPYKEMKLLEECLGVASFYQNSHFVYNRQKRFYCFNRKKNNPLCLGRSKGRQHPLVQQNVISKLKLFFSPWNHELYNLLNRTDFDWETSESY